MEQLPVEQQQVWVGRSVPAMDAVQKVTGKGLYAYDMSLPNALHVKVKRSPVPHARIKRIDSTAALALKGVRAIMTGKDFPDKLFGKGLMDSTVLAKDRVRYVGEAVAAVAADTEEIAAEAADAISLEYEELPAIYDPVVSAGENPPVVVHQSLESYERSREGPYVINLVPSRPNVNCYYRVANGNLDDGFRKADLVVENEYRTPRVHQYHTEPISCMARAEGDGSVTVFTGAQETHKIRRVISTALGIPEAGIHVVIPVNVGGAFGNRASGREEALCAALALKTGRPVKFSLTREEVITATTSRHAAVIRIKDGVMKSGEIVAREITVYLAGGAYSTEGITAVPNAARASASTYFIENFRSQIFRAYTNEMEGGAMRAFGYTYLIFAIESQMDAIAAKLGLDPIEMRARHMLKDGQRSVAGELVVGDTMDACLKRVLNVMNLPKEASSGRWITGRGFGIAHKGVYGNFPTLVYVRYSPDDTIEVRAGIFDVGQGARTVARQLVADQFEHPLESVKLAALDSDVIPQGPGAMGSRQTFHIGNALVIACNDCKNQILAVAARQLGRSADDLALATGWVLDAATRQRLIPVGGLFKRSPSGGAYVEGAGEFLGKGVFLVKTASLDPVTGKSTGDRTVVYYTPVAAGAEVKVDSETGRVVVSRIVVATDAGKILNPKLVEGQIEGCVAQAIGTALTEELVLSKGKVLNPDNKDYKVPMAADIPATVKSIIMETPVEGFELGVRGVGEIALAAVPAAIANAVCNAVGRRIDSLPYSAEKVLGAMRGAEKASKRP